MNHEYNKAIEYHQKALKIRKEKLGANHPKTKRTQKNLILAQQALAKSK